MRPLRVLIVEDEPNNRELAERIAHHLGFETACCQNGAEALAWFQAPENVCDLVLMDVLMPVMDGIEATRRLRSLPQGRDLSIVCVSAKASGNFKQQAFEAGCDAYLVKPFRWKELHRIVERTLKAKGVLGEPLPEISLQQS